MELIKNKAVAICLLLALLAASVAGCKRQTASDDTATETSAASSDSKEVTEIASDSDGGGVPGEEVPGEEVYGEEVPGEEVSGEEVPGEEVSGEEVYGEEVYDEAVASDADAEHLTYSALELDESFRTQDEAFWAGMEIVREAAYSCSGNVSDANLLLCQYYRSKREKFLTNSWNTLAGAVDYDFVLLVDEKDTEGRLAALTEQGGYIEPVAAEKIEITHIFASLNLLIKHRQLKLEAGNSSMNSYIYDLGTWAGDCYELTAYLLESFGEDELLAMSDDELLELAKEYVGIGGHFWRDDMLADIDTFNITADMLAPDEDLLSVFYKYYFTDLSDNNRFELFLANRYGADTSTSERIKTTQAVLLSKDNLYMPLLRKSLSIDISNECHYRLISAVAEAFVDYVELWAGA